MSNEKKIEPHRFAFTMHGGIVDSLLSLFDVSALLNRGNAKVQPPGARVDEDEARVARATQKRMMLLGLCLVCLGGVYFFLEIFPQMGIKEVTTSSGQVVRIARPMTQEEIDSLEKR